VKDLLALLGKRVHDMRAAKKWSQEEFAHICGFHRTYAGQVERGEKNISFGNLAKVASALGVTVSELLAGLEDGTASDKPKSKHKAAGEQKANLARQTLTLQRLIKRLGHQRTEMDRTISALQEFMTEKAERKTK
jgi:transcriptional regulator with XRE-family HTH domain